MLGKLNKAQKGFTLIELLIVIAILGIISAVAIPLLTGALGNGNIAAANQEISTVKTAAQVYAIGNGATNTDVNTLTLYTDGDLSVATSVEYWINLQTFNITGIGTTDKAGLNTTGVNSTLATTVKFDSTTQTWHK